MSIQNTISKLTREVISTFAQLDSWFDREAYILQCSEEGKWNGFQVLEHVSLANRFLLKLIEKGVHRAVRVAAEGTLNISEEYDLDERKFSPISNPEAFSWQSPRHMIPSGMADALSIRITLRDQLHQLLCLLDEMPVGEGALAKTTMSVNGLGKIDVYQYIYFLCLHARRHLRQLEKNASVCETP